MRPIPDTIGRAIAITRTVLHAILAQELSQSLVEIGPPSLLDLFHPQVHITESWYLR